jgi:hypothetical protein
LHRTHPFFHKENHEKLLSYLKARLLIGKKPRDNQLPRYVHTDQKVAGWLKLSQEDQKRRNESNRTGKPIMSDIVLPLEFVHLDDMMTYFAQTFAPNRGMFYFTGEPDETPQARGLVTKMNNDALYSGYFREILRTLFSVLKYNIGGVHVAWGSDQGPRVERAGEQVNVTQELKWAGNRMKSVDMYNFLYDPTCELVDLHKEGEFAAFAEVRSHFWVQKRAVAGQFYNCQEAFKKGEGFEGGTVSYYRAPPQEAKLSQTNDGTDNGQTNWVQVLSDVDLTEVGGHELVHIYIWLNPVDFGLVPPAENAARRGYELWRFTIMDAEWIVSAEQQNNMHGQLPFYFGVINDDLMGAAQKSVAELLEPLQDFASALLNIHIKGSRESIWGTTFYDPTMFDFSAVAPGEVGMRVPMKSSAIGRDIRTGIFKEANNVDTRQTMQDVDSVMTIINQFFPTQSLPSQIASIDRAVTDQVAAVQQGANRRQQKSARLLDDSMFRPMRSAMYYNVIQYSPTEEEITDYYSGKIFKLSLADMKDTNLPFIIGQGLKALDRTAAQQAIQQLIFALIQAPQVLAPNPQTGEQIDIMKMIDHWTTMMDIEANFEQFKTKPPTPPAAPGAADPAAALAAAAGGITPATDPAAVTAPIFG